MCHATILAFFVFLCGGNVFAADSAIEETARRAGISRAEILKYLGNCEESQFTMNLCAHYEYVKADLELNREYKKLAARKDERNVKALREAQRAWVQMRDLNCLYESSDLEGGSLRPAVELSCLRRVTQERTEWVLEMLSCTSIHGECRSTLKGGR